MKGTLEICCTSLEDAKHAFDNGADRIELCEKLSVGGVTPSLQLIESVISAVQIPVFVLIRPRPGDFVFNNKELKKMLSSIQNSVEMGVSGIVSGALKLDNNIDMYVLDKLIEASRSLPFTFHRAFDESENIEQSFKELRSKGVDRVLSSAGLSRASDDPKKISRFVQLSESNPRVLCCGGIRSSNIRDLLHVPELHEFHSAASLSPLGVDPSEVRRMRDFIDVVFK